MGEGGTSIKKGIIDTTAIHHTKEKKKEKECRIGTAKKQKKKVEGKRRIH